MARSPMLHDLRFALRQIARHRWFSAAVVATLALGIGINTTVFTLVNAVLFKPVPIPGGERLVIIRGKLASQPDSESGLSLPEYREFREQAKTLAAVEAMSRDDAVISETGNPPERYRMGVVTPGLFGMLRTPPVLGRDFTAADGMAGAPAVLLLSHDVWQKRYAGAADVVGRTVRLNGAPATIIGVMPPGFRFPNNEYVWSALVPAEDMEKRDQRNLQCFALLRPGADQAGAESGLAVIAARAAQEFPDTNKDRTAFLQTFHQAQNGGPIRIVFLAMLGAVGFVLLIACANVANMMLSRALGRTREIAMRAALGASRPRLVRQLLVESVLLSALGGLLGLGLAAGGVHAFDLATQDVGKPYWIHFTMDWRAGLYFAAISVLSGVVFGLAPALRASRVDLNTALKSGTAGGINHGGKLTGALVVFQFALTVILLAGAGLMIRSFFAVQRVNPFVPAERILTARLNLPSGQGERYETPESRQLMNEKLRDRLARLPVVTSVVLASNFPGMGAIQRDVEIEGRPVADPKQRPKGAFIATTPGYLAASGLPLLAGRELEETDGDTGREVAVVTRALAAKFWPGEAPLGRRFRFIRDDKPGPWMTIVGLSGDIVQDTQDRSPPPHAYVSMRQNPHSRLGLMLRTEGDAAALTGALRAAVQELDPDLPLIEARTLRTGLDRQSWFLVVFGSLFFAFAAIALLMASVGIYAVVAQSTARRTREIGIRMALGATAGAAVRLVLRRGLLQLGLGLALGLGGALAATRVLDSLLGMVSATDPLVFGTVMGLLFALGLFACWLPARRAARVSPTEALRAE